MAGVPAVTAIVPGVEASCAATKATSGKFRVVAALPPPAFDVGFGGLKTLMVTVPELAKSLGGTVIVNDVPAALAVPVSAGLLPRDTWVELLNPVPVNVICWGVTPVPTIRPALGENEDCVGAALSMFVTSAGDDLSVLLESLGSATVAVFDTLGNAPGTTETVRVTVLLPPAAASAEPEYVHVTACPVAVHDQFAPEPETKLRTAGRLSVTVTLPVVGPVPVFVTLMV